MAPCMGSSVWQEQSELHTELLQGPRWLMKSGLRESSPGLQEGTVARGHRAVGAGRHGNSMGQELHLPRLEAVSVTFRSQVCEAMCVCQH